MRVHMFVIGIGISFASLPLYANLLKLARWDLLASTYTTYSYLVTVALRNWDKIYSMFVLYILVHLQSPSFYNVHMNAGDT